MKSGGAVHGSIAFVRVYQSADEKNWKALVGGTIATCWDHDQPLPRLVATHDVLAPRFVRQAVDLGIE